jgi:broad specificity phosphatase PhoE
MPRAVKTAESIQRGKIIQMKELREISFPHFQQIFRRKLPFMLWAMLIRGAWKINHKSMPENKFQVRKRIGTALEKILFQNEGNVLIVSHAAFMMEMRKELLKRGFTGPKFQTAANGRLYVFEKYGMRDPPALNID